MKDEGGWTWIWNFGGVEGGMVDMSLGSFWTQEWNRLGSCSFSSVSFFLSLGFGIDQLLIGSTLPWRY